MSSRYTLAETPPDSRLARIRLAPGICAASAAFNAASGKTVSGFLDVSGLFDIEQEILEIGSAIARMPLPSYCHGSTESEATRRP
jgi:hypothetical protein